MRLPLARARPDAALGVLDVSEYVGATSGGVRTYLLEKSRYVAARPALRQAVITPGAVDDVSDLDGGRWYQLRGPAIPFQPTYRFLLATRSVRQIIAVERPDIIEVGSAYFAPWVVHLARRRHHARVVWFYHSNLPRLAVPERWRDRGRGRVLALGVRRYVRHVGAMVDATLAASDFSAAELAAAGVDRVRRVTLGVDTERFTPARRDHRDRVREMLGITSGPLVGFIGRFADEKRVGDLLTAWPSIERRTGATLLLVGHGPLEPRLRHQAAGRRVVFHPFERDRNAVADLLAALDLYVSPAPFETFGLAVCEALASGTPVLAVDHGAAAELVRNSGGGALVPVGDIAAMADAAVGLLESDRAVLAAAGRGYAVASHAWRVALDGLFRQYRALAAA